MKTLQQRSGTYLERWLRYSPSGSPVVYIYVYFVLLAPPPHYTHRAGSNSARITQHPPRLKKSLDGDEPSAHTKASIGDDSALRYKKGREREGGRSEETRRRRHVTLLCKSHCPRRNPRNNCHRRIYIKTNTHTHILIKPARVRALVF